MIFRKVTTVTFLFLAVITLFNHGVILKLIARLVSLSNPKTFSFFKTNFNALDELSFIPVAGIALKNPDDNSFAQISCLMNQNELIKIISSNDEQEKLIVFRSINDLIELNDKLKKNSEPNFQKEILKVLNNYLSFGNNQYQIGKRYFKYSEPVLMGIVNVTPDSFSDGGKYFESSNAIKHALQLIEDGADIIDIGGESTRPGADEISEEEEIRRIIPVIEGILKQTPEVLISVDTTKSNVAKAALKNGAVMINDISGLTFDNKIADVAAEFNASLVVMHIKGTPRTMQVNPYYENLISEIYEHLYLQCKKAEACGVKNIIIDPGIGFGKTVEQNFEILNRLEDFKSLGYPIMIGVSRKSFLGKTLNLEVSERDISTVIAETFSLMKGASIIRTHNIKNAKQLKTIYQKLN